MELNKYWGHWGISEWRESLSCVHQSGSGGRREKEKLSSKAKQREAQKKEPVSTVSSISENLIKKFFRL